LRFGQLDDVRVETEDVLQTGVAGSGIVHAEYRGTVGEPAFAALLGAAQADAAGRFCFLPSAAGEKPSPSRTIDKPVDRLLLSIATAIDEKG